MKRFLTGSSGSNSLNSVTSFPVVLSIQAIRVLMAPYLCYQHLELSPPSHTHQPVTGTSLLHYHPAQLSKETEHPSTEYPQRHPISLA
jgi:hypothetical protein